MLENLWLNLTIYGHQLQKVLLQMWHNLTPMQYGSILIGIAVFGWLLMKAGAKHA